MRLLLALVLQVALAGAAVAADRCEAQVLHDVVSISGGPATLRAGEFARDFAAYRVDLKTGGAMLCRADGTCFPTRVPVGGRSTEALRLTTCTVSRAATRGPDASETPSTLQPMQAATRSPPSRRATLDRRFAAMGLCPTCSGNVVEMYLAMPQSRCARLTRSALAGNGVAIATLRDFPEYCVPPQ